MTDPSLADFIKGEYVPAAIRCTSLLSKLNSAESKQRCMLLVNRATCYLQLGLFKHCIRDAHDASNIDSVWFRPRYLIIRALVCRGRIDEAISVYNDWQKIGMGEFELQEEINNLLFHHPNSCKKTIEEKKNARKKCEKKKNQKEKQISVKKTKKSFVPPQKIQKIKAKDQDKTKAQNNGKIKDKNNKDNDKNQNKSKGKENNKYNSSKTSKDINKNLSGGSVGDFDNNIKINQAYLFINTGKHQEGLKIFNDLLAKNPVLYAAQVGRGCVYALRGQYDKAILEFKRVIKKDKNNIDAYVRLGQTLTAKSDTLKLNPCVYSKDGMNLQISALKFLSKAIKITKRQKKQDKDTSTAFLQRAIVYKNMGDFLSAVEDAKEAIKRNPEHRQAYSLLGKCYGSTGNNSESKKAYREGILRDPKNEELYLNLGQAHRDWGDYESAEKYFTKSIEVGNDYSEGYGLRALTRYFAGYIELACQDLDTRQQKEGIRNHSSLGMRGTAYMSIGQYRLAMRDFNLLFKQHVVYPMIMCWYRREMVPIYQKYLDTPFSEYNLDRNIHTSLKDIYLKVGDPSNVSSSYKRSDHKLDKSIPDVNLENITSDQKLIVRGSAQFAHAQTYSTPGFMQNIRFHRLCGLAVLEMAQILKKYWKKPFKVDGKSSSYKQSLHEFGWRDLMDITVRWRQHTEPNDPVFWIDLIENNDINMGFALQTPVISGQMKIIKYYPYFDRCFRLLKQLIPKQSAGRKLSYNQKMQVGNSKTAEEMHNIVGEDFFVITPCHPRAGSKIMEGTRLTLQKQNYGHLLTIRTPGIPGRGNRYDKELKKVFKDLAENAKKKNKSKHLEKTVELSLIFYFYWVNFGPLTRGTAATGGLILHALIIANGYKVVDPIPKGKQIDWMAITTPTHTEFIKDVRPWLNVVPMSKVDNHMPIDDLPQVSEHVKTIRDMITVLNIPWKKHIPKYSYGLWK